MSGSIEKGFEGLSGKCIEMLLPSQSGFGAAEPVGSPAWGALDVSYWVLSLSSLINESLHSDSY